MQITKQWLVLSKIQGIERFTGSLCMKNLSFRLHALLLLWRLAILYVLWSQHALKNGVCHGCSVTAAIAKWHHFFCASVDTFFGVTMVSTTLVSIPRAGVETVLVVSYSSKCPAYLQNNLRGIDCDNSEPSLPLTQFWHPKTWAAPTIYLQCNHEGYCW